MQQGCYGDRVRVLNLFDLSSHEVCLQSSATELLAIDTEAAAAVIGFTFTWISPNKRATIIAA